MFTQKDVSEANQRLSVDYGPGLEPHSESMRRFLIDDICIQAKILGVPGTTEEEILANLLQTATLIPPWIHSP